MIKSNFKIVKFHPEKGIINCSLLDESGAVISSQPYDTYDRAFYALEQAAYISAPINPGQISKDRIRDVVILEFISEANQ